ncbi:MAG: HD domain-containing protein [Spirochaetaceae bacterium]|nr:HD domain-containing protein [Spirochaetaceae bacterium]
MSNIFSEIKDDNLQKILSFIVEVDKIKNIMRRTLLIDGSRRENDAEHSWHLAIMAMLLTEYADDKNFTLDKVLKMVIVHDLVEIYAGDTFAFDVKGNLEKEDKEKQAADKLFGQLPSNQGKQLRKLWEEFDEAKTPEARYAAALDRLQPFIHNLCTEGHTWVLGKVTKEQVYKRSGLAMEVLPALKPWMEEQINDAIKKGWISE